MQRNFHLEPKLPYQWVVMDDEAEWPGVRERATVAYVKAALEGIAGIGAVAVELDETGAHYEPQKLFGVFEHTVEEGLPSYVRVRIEKRMPGGRIAHITVHAPLVWNGRFIGITGGGSATRMDYQQYLMSANTPWTIAVKNGFACAETDCSLDHSSFSWGFKEGSSELDWDLLRAWAHEAAHDVAVVGKRVVEALYGQAPAFSYAQGISAGGRTVHGEVQRHPMDYDGAWAECAAVPWTAHLLTQSWVYFAMRFGGHFISKAKMEAVYQALLAKYGCEEKGYVDTAIFPELDPGELVGIDAPAGPFSDDDARVLAEIFAGPHYADGRPMELCDAMGPGIRYASFLAYDEAGEVPHGIVSQTALQAFRWALNDPERDFDDISREDFDFIYDRGASSFKDFDNQDPDIRPFAAHGGKLLLTHATSDYAVPVATTLKYRGRVERVAGEEAAADFMRCYVSMGGGHGDRVSVGEIVSFPHAWAALMAWVEDGIAPGSLPTQTWDFEKGELTFAPGNVEPFTSAHPEATKVVLWP